MTFITPLFNHLSLLKVFVQASKKFATLYIYAKKILESLGQRSQPEKKISLIK